MATAIKDVASGLGASAVESTLQSIKRDNFANEHDRKRALRAARSLCRELETPIETVLRISWVEASLYTALRIGFDVNLFEALSADDGKPKTCAQLAETTRTDPSLLGRLLRHMAAMQYIQDCGPDSFGPTDISRALQVPSVGSGIPYMFDCELPVLAKLPEFLKKNNYRNPVDNTRGPWKFGAGTEQEHFPWLNEHPEILGRFANHMAGYAAGRPMWFDIYPVSDRLAKDAKQEPDAVFLVDVGGSIGHDIKAFRKECPSVPGKIVLQDQEKVVAQVDPGEKDFEPMAHDFFTPQSVKGARVYYLHSVLHDWPDADAIRILENLKPALTPGYSKVIINENIIPNTGADPIATALDLGMLCLNTSSERTEQDWTNVLNKAGFKVTGTWAPQGGESQGVVEAELA